MSNRKTINEKIEAAKIEKQQAEARIKKLLQEQKSQERKDRNHRLCRRGGKLEKLFPELALLTEEQFETFVEKCLRTNHTRRILAELAPPESVQAVNNTAVEIGEDTATQSVKSVAQHSGSVGGRPAEAARVAV
ncbi:MAG: DUF3847 domain-containing protein [Lachnospiraceae bacterium]|nr:DUF3847 domain-containing protein [Lachnospiraceae bacterium]